MRKDVLEWGDEESDHNEEDITATDQREEENDDIVVVAGSSVLSASAAVLMITSRSNIASGLYSDCEPKFYFCVNRCRWYASIDARWD